MDKPVFSIVLPTFNRAYVLWRAIQSVIDQTEKNWELIVVDDGSTDDTLRLIEEFHNSKIRTISINNCGPSAARNVGISHAKGEFVAYLDSDNIWEPRFLSCFYECILKEPENVLWYCGQHCIFWERTYDGKWHLEREHDEPRSQYVIEDVLSLSGVDTNSIVHRKSVIRDIMGWDEQCNWLEDWDFFLRVFLSFPNRVRWIPKILVEYRQVHGTGADGICGEARENLDIEYAGRQYLHQKWGKQLTPRGIEKLNLSKQDLPPRRSRANI